MKFCWEGATNCRVSLFPPSTTKKLKSERMPVIVNGETVDDSLVRQEAAMLRPQYEAAMQDKDPIEREMELWEWSRENVIERTLLRQEAWKDPDTVPERQVEEALAPLRERAGCEPGFDEAQ